MQARFEELQQTNLQLQDENTLLKVQLSTGTAINQSHNAVVMTPMLVDSSVTDCDKTNVTALQTRIQKLEAENAEKEEELAQIHKDQEDLLELLTHQECTLTSLKERLRQLGENAEEFEDGDSDSNPVENET